jgi:hypothetical protein
VAFQKIEPKSYSVASIKPGAVAITVRKGPRNSILMLVRLGSDVAAKMGWDDKAKVDVLWGTDRDHGKIRLEANSDGGRAHTYRAKYRQVSISTFPYGAPAFCRAVAVAHEILTYERVGRPALLITLPKAALTVERAA